MDLGECIFPVPQASHLLNGGNNRTYLIGFLRAEVNEAKQTHRGLKVVSGTQ